jgi:type I restriction-modification system DNA methylase subunit
MVTTLKMANEKKTDIFISRLLESAQIQYTPNGSDIKEIQDALKSASKKGTGKSGFPEFVAISKDFILVIENKAELEKQVLFDDEDKQIISTDKKSITDYAENGALHYANKILAETNFKKIFAFGCSGDEKHHIIRPIFVGEEGYRLLNKVENFENFSTANIEKYYKEQVLGETPQETLELEDILNKSRELHEALRNYGQLGDSEKPLVVAALLLALSEESFSIDSLRGDTVKTDGQKIFDALSTHMTRVEVQPEVKKQQVLNQFMLIKDRTLLNQKDERLKVEISKSNYLEKTPLKYFAEYIQKNILSSVISNTTEDVLGRFYGEFIRYSGGDGQTLGVVLTPKHITELFSELIDLQPSDKIFDPCCGTGGFLIAGMHKMLGEAKGKQKDTIKRENIHGIEIREDMFAIATTNMILRGDGKSNLIKDDFLRRKAEDLRKNNYTVGFINPPYSQAKGRDTAHLSEINFIKHLLDSLADGGKCVAIVPQSTMVGKTNEDKAVKKQILENHTLEGVITLNKNTFYGVGTNPCIAVFTAHKPHSDKKYCKFVNYEDDGFIVSKHIGLVETTRAKSQKAHLLDCWLHDKPAESKFMVRTTIEAEDEWLHSFYYFNDEIPKEEEFEKTIADYLTFEFSMIMQGREYLFGESHDNEKKKPEPNVELNNVQWGEFEIGKLFTLYAGKSKGLNHLKKNNSGVSYLGATNSNNGVLALVEMEGNEEIIQKGNCIAFIRNGEGSMGFSVYKAEDFIATSDISVGYSEFLNREIGLFITTIADRIRGKYNFGYKRSDTRLKKEKLQLPICKNGQPNYAYMEQYIRQKEQEKIEKLQNYIAKRIEQVQDFEAVEPLNKKEWGEFFIEDIFNIKAGKRLTKADMKKGSMPFIGASDSNNGITNFVSNTNSSLDSNVLGVNYNGSVVENFYHPYKAIFSDDVKRLSLKEVKGNKFLYLFIKATILKQKSKFQYAYKFNETRMLRQKLLLPIDENGQPDYNYMENYIKKLEYEKLTKYVAMRTPNA